MELVSEATSKRSACKRAARPMAGFRPSDMLGAFFVAAGFHLVLGLAIFVCFTAGIIDWAPARWAGLHLVFVGGVSQLIIGAAQFFAGAFLASGPPARTIVKRQLITWNLATWVVLTGEIAEIAPVVDIGAVLILAGLAFFVLGLRDLRRRSLQTRPWATRWFTAGAAALAAGSVLGALLAHKSALGSDLLSAHITLNVGGWIGIAIFGTLHTYFPSLTETLLRYPRLEPPTFAGWCGGIALLACGLGSGVEMIGMAGLLAMSAAAILLTANLIASVQAAGRFQLQPRLLLAGHLCLIGALGVALVQTTTDGSLTQLSLAERQAIGTLLVGGWVGLTVIGSLLHLVPIISRVRNLLAPPPAPIPGWALVLAPVALAAVATRAAGLLSGEEVLSKAGALAMLIVYLTLVAEVIRRYVNLARGSVVGLLTLKERSEGI